MVGFDALHNEDVESAMGCALIDLDAMRPARAALCRSDILGLLMCLGGGLVATEADVDMRRLTIRWADLDVGRNVAIRQTNFRTPPTQLHFDPIHLFATCDIIRPRVSINIGGERDLVSSWVQNYVAYPEIVNRFQSEHSIQVSLRTLEHPAEAQFMASQVLHQN